MRTPMILTAVAFCLIALGPAAAPAGAATWVVNPDGSGDFPTIQAAIDGSERGDVILLGSGIFTGPGNRDIDFGGRDATVRGMSGVAEDCRIDCGGSQATPHRGFLFASGEGPGARLEALCIEGGYAPSTYGLEVGGAVMVVNSAPVIEGCLFRDNQAFSGGALYGYHSNALVTDCRFLGNLAVFRGGGVALSENSFPVFTGCLFVDNAAENGGALSAEWSTPILLSSTLVGNRAWIGSALSAWYASGLLIERTIIAFNERSTPVACEDSGATLWCCDVYGNVGGDYAGCITGQLGEEGNISADPLFCDLLAGDYTLDGASPCADSTAPNPDCERIGAYPIACGAVPIETISWGRVKSFFLSK